MSKADEPIAHPHKRCKRCGTKKPMAEFYRAAGNRDGFENSCRKCKNAAVSARLAASPTAKARRAECQQIRRRKDLAKHASVILRWNKANPERVAEHRRRTCERYPEKMAMARAKRRARLKGAEGSYAGTDILALYVVQKGKCAYCRVALNKKYDVDHILPLSRGGTNHKRNLQLTCGPCNGSKGARHPNDYARRIGLLL